MSKPRSALPFWSPIACGAIALATAAVGASCSAGHGGGNSLFSTDGNGGASAGTPGGNGTQSGGTGGDNLGFGGKFTSSGSGSMSTGGVDPDGGCAGEATKAQQLPLDMFIMLDQSGSMSDTVAGGGTKWTAVTGALQAFVTQPGLGGISVGIQYFGLPPGGTMSCGCTTDADCSIPGDFCFIGQCIICSSSSGGDSCNATDYSGADVEIAPLPGVATAIINSMAAHSPTTSTPTSAALQGAINHAATWAGSHPGHVVIDVFATDGDPTECDTDLTSIDAIAAAGKAGTPSVLTFVIGVGSSLGALNGIAAAGGTGQAFIVDTTQNVNMQFLAALNAIRGTALGCQYSIPKPAMGTADYGKVNVEYTPGGGGAVQDFPKYQDKAHCPATGDGWYYDNNNAPTQILLCDSSCNKVSADSTGTVNIVLGCQSIIPG
jgi:hypothetical protein